ncbi:hypothetical protein B9Z55_015543 [Caenorhabditis nigoni]|uniref:Integrase catalytic domain-containing protein n=1 Tax=Caenorhabditis nigoni TaxID=1611254 RepID=A0A2G5UAT0_9PELO|nr:hypothetical protein B9Z55_015543 [Caenorhabditis nigoni]
MTKQPCKYPNMGKLPKDRIVISRPYAIVGLDNFGPIAIKNQDGSEGTAYGTIFTCAVTRLVHVEIVYNASALEFLNALRRFVAIRGVPDKIISDNGSNFVLGQKLIQDAIALSPEELQTIQWKFITPYSPWKGGFYERLIKSIKHIFWKSQKRAKLSPEELRTVFYEIAAAINSRPLTTVEDDINSGNALRPMDFINPEMKIVLPIENLMELKEDYRPSAELNALETKMGTIEALKSSMEASSKAWKKWQSKYLAELREHHKSRMDNKRGSPKLPREEQ